MFSGALLTEHYGMSTTATGVALAAVAVAYLLGNRRAGRGAAERTRRAMLASSAGAAVLVALTWSVTPAVAVTLVLFSASAALVATRTVSGTVYGFSVAGDLGREVGTVRAVTTQLGYLLGALVGGAALAVGGFALVGVAMGGLFVASMLPYTSLIVRRAQAAARPGRTQAGALQTRALQLGHGQVLTVRPLRNGDVETVLAVFDRLGEPVAPHALQRPQAAALGRRARAPRRRRRDPARAGRVRRGRRPPGRDRAAGARGFERGDRVRGGRRASGTRHRLGAHRGAARRRAGGRVREVTALVASDNQAAMSLLRRLLGRLDVRFEGPGAVGARGARPTYGWNSRVSSRGRRACSGKRLIPTPSSAPVAGCVAKRGRSVPEVAARLAVAALGGRGDRADEVGALEPDRVVARAEEQPFDDPAEPRVGAAVLGQVGEEPAEPRVVLAEAAVDDDQADVVGGLEESSNRSARNIRPVAYVSSSLREERRRDLSGRARCRAA